jgi:lipopolysaccharide export LptBFGC system permease protein LptF
MTLNELKDEIDKLKMVFVDSSRLQTEYLRKITWSFSSLIFILLGFPMAVITHKREKSANVVLAMLCAALYYLMSLGCEALSIKNIVPPNIIMWVPNTVTAIIAIILNIRCVS